LGRSRSGPGRYLHRELNVNYCREERKGKWARFKTSEERARSRDSRKTGQKRNTEDRTGGTFWGERGGKESDGRKHWCAGLIEPKTAADAETV